MADVQLLRTEDGLEGTVGSHRVELQLKCPRSRGGVRGNSFGAKIGGYWRIESNHRNLNPVGLFLGEYDGEPIHVRSEVHLTHHYALRHADVTGAVGDRELEARAAPVEAPASGPTVVGVDGHFDKAAITLFVTVAGDLSDAHIHGVIGGQAVSIQATRSQVTGRYEGPAALFLLLVGCLIYII